ncbi:MAG: MBL fold metallo-hydrolase [Prosthecochloris sp.]|uniref:MBL fold metallo-hydrolase n=1 Tax=Prosthecochloris sp. ZM_2 TaxID=2045206 RepID=UPI000DF760A9|nr:MBL fold metallo-hydrolase [Prosthecochloris sp. ZM_2]MEC9486336.1 MBL fold metallo-hydrolase [Prosthecochloris sp.]RNA64974.1 MBL fold metallo-hydrolase [Prosthecochloris sp. ZM_2]
MITIGPYTLHSLDVQYFSLDGGAVFGVVPRVMWQQFAEPDACNRVRLSMRLLLICGQGRNILVDAAMGTAWSEKYRDIYQLSDFRLDDELRNVGLGRQDITDIIFTHLHFDHLAGAFERDGEELVPLFPDAAHYVQRRNFETALEPNLKERPSYRQEFVRALADVPRLQLLDGETELADGILLSVTDGHTAGQQLLRVSDSSTTLLHGGDLLPAASHLGFARGLGFDVEPLRVIREKQQLVRDLVEQGAFLYFAHDPRYSCVSLEFDERGEPRVSRVINVGGR